MAIHDTIGDFLTIIRNSSRAGKETCTAQWSRLREGIAIILKREGFIADYKEVVDANGHRKLELSLKYVDGTPSIADIQRLSKPGCRIYTGSDEIPSVLGGLGISILSTSKGILTNKEARRQKLGGELIAKVW
jgi:small subunit ribosomal protein S8